MSPARQMNSLTAGSATSAYSFPARKPEAFARKPNFLAQVYPARPRTRGVFCEKCVFFLTCPPGRLLLTVADCLPFPLGAYLFLRGGPCLLWRSAYHFPWVPTFAYLFQKCFCCLLWWEPTFSPRLEVI